MDNLEKIISDLNSNYCIVRIVNGDELKTHVLELLDNRQIAVDPSGLSLWFRDQTIMVDGKSMNVWQAWLSSPDRLKLPKVYNSIEGAKIAAYAAWGVTPPINDKPKVTGFFS